MRSPAQNSPHGYHKQQTEWHAEPDPQGSDPWCKFHVVKASLHVQLLSYSKDNRLASSIISGLIATDLDVHQITHAQSSASTKDNITVHKSDFTQPSLASLFTTLNPDILFSTQAASSFPFQKELITTAIQTNIPRFVAAEFGHDTLNHKIQGRLPPYKEKAKVIKYLQQRENSLEWTAAATGSTPLDHALLTGTLGVDLKWHSATIPGSGHSKFAASSSSWVGRVAHSIITHWNSIKNQYIYAAGTTVSGNELVQSLRAQTGQTWEVGNVDVEDLVHEGERRFEKGFPDAGMFLMERSVAFDDDGTPGAVRPFVERDAKGLLGLGGGEDVRDVVARVLHEFEYRGKGDCGCE